MKIIGVLVMTQSAITLSLTFMKLMLLFKLPKFNIA